MSNSWTLITFTGGTQVIHIAPCRNIEELTIGFTVPLGSEVQCNRALSLAEQLVTTAILSRANYPALRTIVLDITYEKPTRSRAVFPGQTIPQWRIRSDALCSALAAALHACQLQHVFVEVNAPDISSASADIRGWFDPLAEKNQLVFRERRRDVWQT